VIRLLDLPARAVYSVPGFGPAVFYVADTEGGGILINTPAFSSGLLQELGRLAPPRFAFYPSRLGARDVAAWRAAGIETLAYNGEFSGDNGELDIVLDRKYRFSRTIDFLPMSGRTAGTCALRCKNRPAVMFFGPALECGQSGWPEIVAHADDWSYENRLLGAVGLRHLKYEYAFTDDFDPRTSCWGPGAGAAIAARLEIVLTA
jgi:hypothetical protein